MQTSRLGQCEVCDKDDAKYSCPECEVKTCSLQCVNIHKKELECDGIRSRVKFKTVKDFSDMDFLNDYRLLEEVGRTVEKYSNDKRVHNNAFLPISLFRIRGAALKRNIGLQFLPKEFSRRKDNTSYLNYKTQELFWRIEWYFPQANDSKYVDERVVETELLGNILDKYINPSKNEDKALKYYHAAGHARIMILLKAEKLTGKRFFELDPLVSLCNNLQGKIIIEFPTIHVIMKEHKQCYDIITPDEEEEIMEEWKIDRDQKHPKYKNGMKRNHHGKSFSKKDGDNRNNFFFNNGSDSDQNDEVLTNRFNKVLKTEHKSSESHGFDNRHDECNSYNAGGSSDMYYDKYKSAANESYESNNRNHASFNIPSYDELVNNS